MSRRTGDHPAREDAVAGRGRAMPEPSRSRDRRRPPRERESHSMQFSGTAIDGSSIRCPRLPRSDGSGRLPRDGGPCSTEPASMVLHRRAHWLVDQTHREGASLPAASLLGTLVLGAVASRAGHRPPVKPHRRPMWSECGPALDWHWTAPHPTAPSLPSPPFHVEHRRDREVESRETDRPRTGAGSPRAPPPA